MASWDRLIENNILAGGKQRISQLGGLNLTQHPWGKGQTGCGGSAFSALPSAMGTDLPPQKQDGSRERLRADEKGPDGVLCHLP